MSWLRACATTAHHALSSFTFTFVGFVSFACCFFVGFVCLGFVGFARVRFVGFSGSRSRVPRLPRPPMEKWPVGAVAVLSDGTLGSVRSQFLSSGR